uniref:TTF-type domain-containing protein n=1 Tax=Setaria viridis TaxID=4556 RepID=A0A4V6Y8U8_SETVI|nr:hypothetical protein SEVIR_2G178500v2 [Setaria viridis]
MSFLMIVQQSRKYESGYQKRKKKQRIEDLTQSQKDAMDKFVRKESQGLACYSKELDWIFCFGCKLFTKGHRKGQLANEGFNDWIHLGIRLKEHETSNTK